MSVVIVGTSDRALPHPHKKAKFFASIAAHVVKPQSQSVRECVKCECVNRECEGVCKIMYICTYLCARIKETAYLSL